MSNLITIGGNGLARLGRSMKTATVEAKAAMNAGLLEVAAAAAEEAKSRSSWSKRIPVSIRPGGTGARVWVRAGGAKAPHAPAYENHGADGQFRHPVFGNREVWVSEDARPFLAGAVEKTSTAGGETIAAAIARKVEES